MSESEAGSSRGLPEGLLLSFYGDDFTGSTSVMEALTFAGLPTVLFLDVPTAAQLAALRRLPCSWYRGRRPVAKSGLDGRPSAAHLPRARRVVGANRTLQGLFDIRFRAACRLDRARDRPCGASFSAATGILFLSRLRRLSATRPSAIYSRWSAVWAIGSTGIPPCRVILSRRCTRRMCVATSPSRPPDPSAWSISSR